jgi:hypothetical protein
MAEQFARPARGRVWGEINPVPAVKAIGFSGFYQRRCSDLKGLGRLAKFLASLESASNL